MVRVGGYSHNEVLGPERAAGGINQIICAWQSRHTWQHGTKKKIPLQTCLNNSGWVSPPAFVWVTK